MQLHEALAQISEIRQQMDRSDTFRGYRSATVAVSGFVAIVAAVLQSRFVPSPAENIHGYLTLWICVAVLSVLVTAVEMIVRSHRSDSPHAVRLTRLAVEQFLPCVLAGGSLTFVITLYAPQSLWMLPGLWSIIFSLGVFASCRLLPAPVYWIGAHYLIAGLLCFAFARDAGAFSPWSMVLTFGVGQLATAAILYWKLERTHD